MWITTANTFECFSYVWPYSLLYLVSCHGMRLLYYYKHIYEGADWTTNPVEAEPIGTSPFKFVSWKSKERVWNLNSNNPGERQEGCVLCTFICWGYLSICTMIRFSASRNCNVRNSSLFMLARRYSSFPEKSGLFSKAYVSKSCRMLVSKEGNYGTIG